MTLVLEEGKKVKEKFERYYQACCNMHSEMYLHHFFFQFSFSLLLQQILQLLLRNPHLHLH